MPAPQQGAAHVRGCDLQLCFPGTCCGSQIETLSLAIQGQPVMSGGGRAWQCGQPGWADGGEGLGTAALPRREGPSGAGVGTQPAGVGAEPAGALTALLAPSLPPSSLLPPSLPGRRRVSAVRRPGNAADAPRSIPGGGSTPILPQGRRGLGAARSRRLVQGQGGSCIGPRGSRCQLPLAHPRRAPGSAAWGGAAGRRPQDR